MSRIFPSRQGRGGELKSPILLFSALFLALFAACSSTPKLSDYPARQIDRPAVLPEGVSAWSPLYARSFDRDAHSYLYPFRWEQGYTERLTLTWMPLPFQARYRLLQDESGWLTLEGAFLGPVEARDRNFDWRPRLELQALRRFGSQWALNASTFAQFEVKRTADPKVAQTYGIGPGVLLQATEGIALGTKIWLWRETGYAWAHYLGSIPAENQGSGVRSTRWRFPLELTLSWALSPQWELAGRLINYRWGYESTNWSAPLYLSVTHRW